MIKKCIFCSNKMVVEERIVYCKNTHIKNKYSHEYYVSFNANGDMRRFYFDVKGDSSFSISNFGKILEFEKFNEDFNGIDSYIFDINTIKINYEKININNIDDFFERYKKMSIF